MDVATSVLIDSWVALELVCILDSQTVETVFNYQATPALTTEGEAIALATNWMTIMTPLLVAAGSAQLTFDHINVRAKNKTLPNVTITRLFPPGTVGATGGDASPGNATLAVKQMTGRSGKSYRGRNFWPGLAEGQTIGNQVISALITALSIIFTRNLTGFVGVVGTYIPCVPSRKLLQLHNIVAFSMDKFIDSQRRRLTGRGR